MSLALLLFQAASPTPTPASTPEKFPAWLTLIYVSGFAVIALLLIVSLIRNRPFRSAATVATAPGDLPKEVRKRLGATLRSGGLHPCSRPVVFAALVGVCLVAVIGYTLRAMVRTTDAVRSEATREIVVTGDGSDVSR